MNCTGCGKPLSVEELLGDNCPYCDVALPHRVEAIKESAKVKEILRDSDGDGVPDVLEGTALDPKNQAKAGPNIEVTVQAPQTESNMGLWVAVFTIVVASVGRYALEMEDSPLKPLGVIPPKKVYDTCFVDANSDGVFDFAVNEGLKHKTPMIVDGSTGKKLWEGEVGEKGQKLMCVDERWFAISRPDFRISFHDSQNPDAPISLMATDTLQSATMGEGCIAYQTADDKRGGVSIPNGGVVKCARKGALKKGYANRSAVMRNSSGLFRSRKNKVTIRQDGKRYTLTARSRGTPMLTLRISKGKKTILNKELPYREADDGCGIAASDGIVMILAAPKINEDMAMLIGFKEETGEKLYERVIEVYHLYYPLHMDFNGKHVIINHFGNMYAYDIKTGQKQWHF